jgi:hypothetical protein
LANGVCIFHYQSVIWMERNENENHFVLSDESIIIKIILLRRSNKKLSLSTGVFRLFNRIFFQRNPFYEKPMVVWRSVIQPVLNLGRFLKIYILKIYFWFIKSYLITLNSEQLEKNNIWTRLNEPADPDIIFACIAICELMIGIKVWPSGFTSTAIFELARILILTCIHHTSHILPIPF